LLLLRGSTGVTGVASGRSIALGRNLTVRNGGRKTSERLAWRTVRATATNHARLRRISHDTTARTRSVAGARVVHGRTAHVASRRHAHGLVHAEVVALSDLALQLLTTNIATLSERNVKRLGANHLVVHLRDSLGGLIRRREADETKAL
jgi:hypothetical protein